MDETIYVIFKVQFDFALEVWFSLDKYQRSRFDLSAEVTPSTYLNISLYSQILKI